MDALGSTSPTKTVLGLDIGVASLGWALIDDSDEDAHVIAAGVRLFDAGVEGSQKNIADGRDVPRSQKRTEKRQIRRQPRRQR